MKHFNNRLLAISKLASLLLSIILFPVFIFNYISFFFQKKINNKSVRKILIVDFHLIGDIVMLTPLLKELRSIYPDSSIALLSGHWSKDILANNPGLIDTFITYNAPWTVEKKDTFLGLIKIISLLRGEAFDIAIDVRGDFRNIIILKLSKIKRLIGFSFSGGGWLLSDKIYDNGELDHIISHHHRIAQHLGSNISLRNFLPELWLSKDEKKCFLDKKKYIAIHFGASKLLRILSLEDAREIVTSLLREFDKDLVLFYSDEIKDLINYIIELPEVAGNKRIKVFRGNLREFLISISGAELYIGMDSSGAHIAASFKIHTIVIFGPAEPKLCRPIGNSVKTISLSKHLDCRPCNQITCTNSVYQRCYKELDISQEIIKNYSSFQHEK
jgi:ADP-heptose:LPS heptosyltransferase